MDHVPRIWTNTTLQAKVLEAEMTMLDAQMARLERLDYLHSLNLPIDVSLSPLGIHVREADLCIHVAVRHKLRV